MKDRTSQIQLHHLYRRIGFSGIPSKNSSLKKAINKFFKDSESYSALNYQSLSGGREGGGNMGMDSMKSAEENEDQKKLKQKMNRENIRKLNIAWVDKMATGEGVFRERMALFWHGHFACRVDNPEFVHSYIETIRKHALGNFGEMLLAVSREPAMLQFLNNQQNRKNRPNENFAREVMELFTMGIGNYTESDVKEAARAFTGWGFNKEGSFEFKQNIHDKNDKKFLGNQGNFQGEDIIRMLLQKKETAHFVTTKIYRSFVSEIHDKNRVDKLAEGFYTSGYDISSLMRNILEADWFYENAPTNLLIKSPVELMVGIQRTLNATFTDFDSMLYVQKVLGQLLFYPPNVAGWPGGRNWIDSSSLLFRMQLPTMMAGSADIKVKAKDSGDVNDLAVNRSKKDGKAIIDWNKWAEEFKKIETEKLPDLLVSQLLAASPSPDVMKLLYDIKITDSDRPQYIRKLTLAVMSLPEYQIA